MTLTLSRLRSAWDHHLNKLGRPHIPNATFQVSRSLAFWFWRRRFLKGFYHSWAWRSSWSCDLNILYTFWLIYHKKSSNEILVQLSQWFVRKLCLNILMRLQNDVAHFVVQIASAHKKSSLSIPSSCSCSLLCRQSLSVEVLELLACDTG